jgi:pyruvate dehydrogenase E1 component alpha subunit
MLRIRAFEEKVSELYARGKVAGLLHLGIGPEAVAVGVTSVLRPDDAVVGGHRAHANALATGAEPARLMAEIAGRSGGYGSGKGGSMHLVASESGFLTATGVVGGNIPLALGAAFAATYAGSDAVAVVFFGDGAGQTGPFHESLNVASLWSLPVVFVCENNGYAEFTPLSAHTKVERLSAYAAAYGMPAVTIDGNDVDAVRAAAADAVGRARAGRGPTFVEALTYRLRGHYEGDPAKYRELSELDDWKAKDPIARLRSQLAAGGTVDAATAARQESDERAAIEAAAVQALASPPPEPSDLATGVYA